MRQRTFWQEIEVSKFKKEYQVKEPEFVLSSDKQNWMDTAVISTTPYKVTIIDPHQYVAGMIGVFDQLDVFVDAKLTGEAKKHLARQSVLNVMESVIGRCRAWENGSDVDFEIHPMNMRSVITNNMEQEMRSNFWDEIGHSSRAKAWKMMDHLLKDIIKTMLKHMNPNRFVVHTLEVDKDLRKISINEFADWRVIQYTKNEVAKIDARHENI